MFFRIIALAVLIVNLSCQQTSTNSQNSANNVAGTSSEWSYTGDVGPSHWSSMSTDFAACGAQSGQSPVNFLAEINSVCPVNSSTPQLGYAQVAIAQVINNGHTVEYVPDAGSYPLNYGGKTYQLAQFHLHAPSEHQIEGSPHTMEIHFVHKTTAGDVLVLGVLVDISATQQSSALAPFWQDVTAETPSHIHVSQRDTGHANANDSNLGTVNMSALLPQNTTAFHYVGSLTTPPCTPGVQWFVYKNPVNLTGYDYDQFSQQIGINARPTQGEQALCGIAVT